MKIDDNVVRGDLVFIDFDGTIRKCTDSSSGRMGVYVGNGRVMIADDFYFDLKPLKSIEYVKMLKKKHEKRN